MALDEVLLRAAGVGGPPVVRLYQWQPACLSLGYGQPVAEVDRAACAAAGVDLARRLTGGRAVLHQTDEWTYSVAIPADLFPVGRSVSRCYGLLSGAVSRALAELGISAGCTPRASADRPGRDPACFAATIGGDLATAGRKLVGSAQCHKFGGILQHGSIPQTVDEELLATVLRRPVTERHWTCLAELGLAPDRDALVAAFASGWADLLGGPPQFDQPTAEELAAATALAASTYASEAWLARL